MLLDVGRLRAGLADPAGQPRPQRGQAQLRLGRLGVEQLGYVAEVGEHAFPVHFAQQPAGKAFADADVVEEGGHPASPQKAAH